MKLPVHYKITFVLLIIIAVILSGIYLYLNKNLREYTFQRIKTNLINQLTLCKSYLEEESVQEIQSYEIDTVADKIGNNLKLRVTIIDLSGTVLGDSELEGKELREVENHLYRPEVQQALKSGMGESRRFSTTLQKDMLYVASVYGKQDSPGIIRLSIPLLEVELISSRLRRTLVLSLIVAFIFAAVISFFISIFISKPVREMSYIVKDIAKGNFNNRVAIRSDDEIGDLAKAFNEMAEQIRLRVQEVTTNKSRLEAVLFSMFEGVMVVDLDGSILLVNQTLKSFLHIQEEPEGRKPLEVVRHIEIQDIVDKTLRLKKGVESCEISIAVPEEKILLVHATPVIRDGISEGAVLVFHDITNLRNLEEIRKDFVANVSHELRTPVSTIKGYAETLLEGALEDKKNAKDFLKIIYDDSDRLARLIEDLLDLSKIESGKLKLVLKVCEIKPVIDKVISGLENRIKSKSLKLNVNIPRNISRIKADEARIAQVLLNLIDNAIKYTNTGDKIIVSARNVDGFVRVDISDSGIGIPEKDLPRLFERFYRIDKARSRELGGTGLGLSIVKHIVQAHKGEVSVQSTLEQGSTFSFTLPKA